MTKTNNEKLERIKSLKGGAEEYLTITPTHQYYNHSFYSGSPHRVRRSLIKTGTINIDGKEIHINGGLDRMPALLQKVEQSNEAGTYLPHIILRDEDNNTVHIHTKEDIRTFLTEAASKTNHVESAHNRVIEKYQEIADIRDDETQDIDNRLEKAEESHKFAKDYEIHLKTEMASYDPDTLPADLPTLKKVYIERLEAVALKKNAEFKNAISQQGVDLPESCDDQVNATRKIAVIKQTSQLMINVLDTVEKAKAEYNSAITKMNNVSPLNTPLFLDSEGVGITSPHSHSGTNPLVIKVDNPTGIDSPINVQVETTGKATHQIKYFFNESGFQHILMTFTPHEDPSTASIVARNICGAGKPLVLNIG
ncbi:MAG: hypothetical protein OXF95_00030 [Rhodobacteraceae bacterium]|nr:hypothetical protein [Paracoccaceae bacterium]